MRRLKGALLAGLVVIGVLATKAPSQPLLFRQALLEAERATLPKGALIRRHPNASGGAFVEARRPVTLRFSLPAPEPMRVRVDEELEWGERTAPLVGGQQERVHWFLLPTSDLHRALVLARKVAPTPPRFPRRTGIPEKTSATPLGAKSPQRLHERIMKLLTPLPYQPRCHCRPKDAPFRG